MNYEGSRDGSLKVTASNPIISWLDVSKNKQYSANGATFLLGTLDKMYLRKLITHNFTAEYIQKFVDTRDVTNTAFTIQTELDARLLTYEMYTRLNSILGSFEKFRKVTTSFDMSVCPSACVHMEHLGSHWTDCHKI
jgi:hypothetical protein